ncbi:MAG: isoprenylcysteine carboxylmethyltransferase family protein [Vicinamibacterales bacterium]
MIAAAALAVAALLMLVEQQRSLRHERLLRQRGASEPPDDVYRAMAWVYPAAFIVMAVEGWWRGAPRSSVLLAGLVLFAAAKALKYWAIASLGERWTFRVLVPPQSPRVTNGPYRWLRHPNYVAVIGELLGFAVLAGAPVAGGTVILVFLRLIWRRIDVEEAALRGT